MNSIIFILNNTLKIVQGGENVKLLQEIFPNENKFLDLSENFAQIYKNFKKEVKKAQKIYFIIGKNAGFTDSRIVYIWLRGENYFEKKPLFIDFAEDLNLDFENEINKLITDLKIQKILEKAEAKNNQKLNYIKDANIGKNKINTI